MKYMTTIGAILGMPGLVILVNVIINAVFRTKQENFLRQFGNNIPAKIENVKVGIQRNDAGFQYLRCDIVISDQMIFLLLKNTLRNTRLQYQPILQLNLKRQDGGEE